MRVSRLAVVVAAAAIVLPAGMASMAMADDTPAGGAATGTPNAENPPPAPPGGYGHGPGRHRGPGGLTDDQRKCMEDKGFGRPDFKPGERSERPSREEMEKKRAERMEAAKACGLPERPQWGRGRGGPGGPGGHGRMHRRGMELTDEQRTCMENKGFGNPNGERPQERPSREEMEKKRSAFEAAAKECGLQMPERRGPGAPPQAVPAGFNA